MNKNFFVSSDFKKRSALYSQSLALESRLVFDGAAVATAVAVQDTANDSSNTNHADAATTPPANEVATQALAENIPPAVAVVDYAPNADTTNIPFIDLSGATATADVVTNIDTVTLTSGSQLGDLSQTGSMMSPSATNIVFIDSAVRNINDIVSSIAPNNTIVYLDAHKDGLTQIADYLAKQSNIDSVQIISHANEASLLLGNEIITNDSLTDYTEQLATIGKSLSTGGDILLYGCDLAKNTDGQQFVDSFSYLTHADVAASTDTTGAADKGGNWTLEYTTGTIEASILAASHYQDILAVPTYDLKLVGELLQFNQATAELIPPGNGLSKDSVIVYHNVATISGQVIDAVVTIVDTTDIVITYLDGIAQVPAPPAPPAPLDPNWFEIDTQSLVSGAGANLKFQFIKGGTYNPVTGLGDNVLLQNLTVNSYDIDNNQFQDFTGFSSYTLAGATAPDTNLQLTMNGDFAHFSEIVVNPNNTGIPGSLVFNQARGSVFFNEINSFQIKTGSGSTATTSVAHFYLDFSLGFAWNLIPTPVTHTVPDAVNDPQIGVVGSPVVIDVLANDKVTENPINIHSVKIVGTINAGDPLTVTGEGIWSVTSDATGKNIIIFTPFSSFTGHPTPIQYTVKDTAGLPSDLATVSIDYPPTAVDDRTTGEVGKPVSIDVLNNDTDPDKDINPTTLKIINPVTSLPVPSFDRTNEGTWSVAPDATGKNIITFKPLPSFTGDPTPIQYTVNDLTGLLSNKAIVSIDYPPTAVDDRTTSQVGKPVSIDVLNNDTDPDKDINPATLKIINPVTSLPVPSFDRTNEGTWSVVPDATGKNIIIFTPLLSFTGNPTPIQYSVNDKTGLLSNSATVMVIYLHPPIVKDDTATGIGGITITIPVLNNDSDPENNLDPSTVKIVGSNQPNGSKVVSGEGTWSVNPDGTITFTPETGFTGSPTPISYTVKDTKGLESASATVTVRMNNLPVSTPDVNTAIAGGGAVTGDIIANEFALGDIPTVVHSANQNGHAIRLGSVFITAAGGILILNADGRYSYTAPLNVPVGGLIEAFNYTIIDFNGDISGSVLTITVQSPTVAPPVPPTPVPEPEKPNFFVDQPVAPATVLDFSLYIPTPDNLVWLTGSLRDQVVLELQQFSFDIPRGSFHHTNPNAQLEFEATRSDGTPLPEWLKFNPKLLRFYGTPPREAHDEGVMVTARDSYGHEVHAVFTVHVNKESLRPEHKALKLDLKLMGLSNKALEKSYAKERSAVGKRGLSERVHTLDKLGKLQESEALLNSLKVRD
jgi:CshA-type fibril repeat protein